MLLCSELMKESLRQASGEKLICLKQLECAALGEENIFVDGTLNACIQRVKQANEKISSDISMVLHPNMSAVEAIERFASDLQRFAGSWERIARDIDQSITELCDDQTPSELIDLQNYISNQGFDKLVDNNLNRESE